MTRIPLKLTTNSTPTTNRFWFRQLHRRQTTLINRVDYTKIINRRRIFQSDRLKWEKKKKFELLRTAKKLHTISAFKSCN